MAHSCRFRFPSLAFLIALSPSVALAQSYYQVPAPRPSAAKITIGKGEDEVLRGQTVLARSRPAYDPIGVHVGGFMFYPSLSAQESYDSNVFATRSSQKSDFITSLAPALDLMSNWDRDALNFHLDSRNLIYADHDTENINDYTFSSNGRWDFSRDTQFFGGLGYKVRHEARSSPNNIFGSKSPTEYADYGGSIGGQRNFGRLSFRLDGTYDKFDFRNDETNSGVPLNEERRNYDQKAVTLHTGYELGPLREVYLLTGYNWRSYDFSADISGFDRNSTGFVTAVGARYDLTGILFADVFVGYRQQDYADSRLRPAEGPTGGAKLTWNVTRLTTITGSVDREVRETDISNASSYFATVGQLRVDHELLRNLILGGHASYEQDGFNGISRDDNIFGGGFDARYLINQYFWVSGGYDYRNRDSNQSSANYDAHVVMLRVGAHL
jgi:hypothetical protein